MPKRSVPMISCPTRSDVRLDRRHDPQRSAGCSQYHTQSAAGRRGKGVPVGAAGEESRRYGVQVRTVLGLFRLVLTNRYSHGDMLFMAYKLQESAPQETEASIPIPSPVASSGGPSQQALTKPLTDLSKVTEDAVDTFWRGKDGKIVRGKDATMCRHGPKGMCDYCTPLEVSFASSPLRSGLTPPAAIRRNLPSHPPNQTPLLPRLPTQTPILKPHIPILGIPPAPTDTPQLPRRRPLHIGRTPVLARGDMHQMPTERHHVAVPIVPYGRSR